MNCNGPVCSTTQLYGESSSSAYNQYFATSGDTLTIRTPRTIATSNASGLIGELCWDSNYIYVCVANNSWRRISLTTF